MSGWGGTQQSLISYGLVPVPVLYTIFQVCRPLRGVPSAPGLCVDGGHNVCVCKRKRRWSFSE